jgi:cellulose biosynthesis protein BcsQ
MKIIALYNIKGGVGKTASAVNLAWLSAQDGYRTLLWDLDPQGAATFYYRVKAKIKGGAESLLKKQGELEEQIKKSDYERLDLLPADFSLRNFDLLLEEQKKPTKRIAKLLEPLADDYDVVFLDCAPSISLVSENVFRAADLLLIPTIPTTLSLRTLKQIYDYFTAAELATQGLLPFFSMVDSRRQLHRLITEQPPQKPLQFLSSQIPYISEIERMGIEQRPACHAPTSRATLAYRALWDEVKELGAVI